MKKMIKQLVGAQADKPATYISFYRNYVTITSLSIFFSWYILIKVLGNNFFLVRIDVWGLSRLVFLSGSHSLFLSLMNFLEQWT